MLDLETMGIVKSMTKSERFLYDLILNDNNFDYSIREISSLIILSPKTVFDSLQKLVKKKLLAKTEFFVGKVKRCKYSVAKNIYNQNYNTQNVANLDDNQNYNMQNVANTEIITDTKSDERVVNNRVVGIKKESRQHTKNNFLNPIITISDNDMIYNINNNIYQSNQSDNTVILGSCQVEKTKKVKKIVECEKFVNDIDNFLPSSLSSLKRNSLLTLFKNIIKRMLKEKNINSKKVIQFFSYESVEDKQEVIVSVLNSFSNRLCNNSDAIRNHAGYLRTSIVNAIISFYENRVKNNEFLTDCKNLINLCNTSEKSVNTRSFNKKTLSYKDFEQREYDDSFFNSFYHCASN